MTEKRLIYILNNYSSKSAQHFYHIIHLLSKMSEAGAKIVLIIEKADEVPELDGDIEVVVQKKQGIQRPFELASLLKMYIQKGYNKVFIRISLNAAIVSVVITRFTKAETYYWQSGASLSFDWRQKGIKKIKWIFNTYLKLWFVKNFGDHFVTGPESMIQYYINELHVKPEKMILLYNDIDISRFKKGTEEERRNLRNALGLPMDAQIVLFVHRLSPVRRSEIYVPQIAENQIFQTHKVYFVIVGDGPDENKIKQAVSESEYRDRFIMLGSKPNAEIQRLYAGADVFVNPSYCEGFPRTVIEAMAAGLPVVVTDVGGTRDILPTEQKRYLIDKDDVKHFREMLAELVVDEKKRYELSFINLQFVKRYSTDAVSRMYMHTIWRE